MAFSFEIEQEEDGRGIAEISELPGAMARFCFSCFATEKSLAEDVSGNCEANRA